MLNHFYEAAFLTINASKLCWLCRSIDNFDWTAHSPDRNSILYVPRRFTAMKGSVNENFFIATHKFADYTSRKLRNQKRQKIGNPHANKSKCYFPFIAGNGQGIRLLDCYIYGSAGWCFKFTSHCPCLWIKIEFGVLSRNSNSYRNSVDQWEIT